MIVSPGDALLYAVSAARDLTWDRFKRAVDATCVPDGRLAVETSHVRAEVLDVGDSLGHWETASAGTTRSVVVAPPVLARLPWPGPPRAVLCGSRSPDTCREIRDVCGTLDGLFLSVTPQPHHPYAPSRIEVRADSEDRMIAGARALSLRYDSTPAAWSLASTSGSLEGYISTLKWTEREELNWDRREFDPARMRFGPPSAASAGQVRLATYSHPSGWDWRDWLWQGTQSADVDRSWGRYYLLATAGRTVTHYDHRRGVATVPRQAPLPRLLARALALSSGEAPKLVPGEGLGSRAYCAVPYAVFDAVATKLEQQRPEDMTGRGMHA